MIHLRRIVPLACRCGGDLVLDLRTYTDLDAAAAAVRSLPPPAYWPTESVYQQPVHVATYNCRNAPACPPSLADRPSGCGAHFIRAEDAKGRLIYRLGEPAVRLW